MQLRFALDQAECFRRGIDCPKSIVSVEVDPAKLEPRLRALIADRMDGIDVQRIEVSKIDRKRYQTGGRMIAKGPSLEDLIAAVEDNEKQVAAEEALPPKGKSPLRPPSI